MTAPLSAEDAALLRQALDRAELVVIPTDTVYGIACDPFQSKAVDALLRAKGRGPAFPPPLLVAHPQQVWQLCSEVSPSLQERALALMDVFWPGPLTLVLPSRAPLGWDLEQTNYTVAVRQPGGQGGPEVLSVTGVLAVTSANLHGCPAATTCTQAQDIFGQEVSVYIDGGHTHNQVASTIVQLFDTSSAPASEQQEAFRILRLGAISAQHITQVLSNNCGRMAP